MHDLWRSAPANEFAWARWGDDYALYHRPSGRTHFLNVAAAALLQDVLRSPLSIESAARELAVRECAEPGDDFLPQVAALLHRLEELGLVHRLRVP